MIKNLNYCKTDVSHFDCSSNIYAIITTTLLFGWDLYSIGFSMRTPSNTFHLTELIIFNSSCVTYYGLSLPTFYLWHFLSYFWRYWPCFNGIHLKNRAITSISFITQIILIISDKNQKKIWKSFRNLRNFLNIFCLFILFF